MMVVVKTFSTSQERDNPVVPGLVGVCILLVMLVPSKPFVWPMAQTVYERIEDEHECDEVEIRGN